jgi:CBS domain-containing protein
MGQKSAPPRRRRSRKVGLRLANAFGERRQDVAITRVGDLMSREVRTVQRNDQLSIADDLLRMERIRHLPVLDDDGKTVLGVLSQRDLFRGALARTLGYGEHAQEKLLGQLLVKEVMTNDPVTVGPEVALAEAARLMLERKIGCLPVIENGRLVGILTEADFVESFAGEGTPS